jgi:hypothetical protein
LRNMRGREKSWVTLPESTRVLQGVRSTYTPTPRHRARRRNKYNVHVVYYSRYMRSWGLSPQRRKHDYIVWSLLRNPQPSLHTFLLSFPNSNVYFLCFKTEKVNNAELPATTGLPAIGYTWGCFEIFRRMC